MNFISLPFLRAQLQTVALKAVQLTHPLTNGSATHPNIRSHSQHALKPAPVRGRTGLFVGGSFWLAFLGMSVFWFNSAQAAHEEQFFDKPNTEDPRIVLARGNMMRFLRTAPRRELIVAPMPCGLGRPKEITLYLSPAWDRESPQTREYLLKTWNAAWAESVQTHPRDAKTPHLYLNRSDALPGND